MVECASGDDVVAAVAVCVLWTVVDGVILNESLEFIAVIAPVSIALDKDGVANVASLVTVEAAVVSTGPKERIESSSEGNTNSLVTAVFITVCVAEPFVICAVVVAVAVVSLPPGVGSAVVSAVTDNESVTPDETEYV